MKRVTVTMDKLPKSVLELKSEAELPLQHSACIRKIVMRRLQCSII